MSEEKYIIVEFLDEVVITQHCSKNSVNLYLHEMLNSEEGGNEIFSYNKEDLDIIIESFELEAGSILVIKGEIVPVKRYERPAVWAKIED